MTNKYSFMFATMAEIERVYRIKINKLHCAQPKNEDDAVDSFESVEYVVAFRISDLLEFSAQDSSQIRPSQLISSVYLIIINSYSIRFPCERFCWPIHRTPLPLQMVIIIFAWRTYTPTISQCANY